VLIFLTHALMR